MAISWRRAGLDSDGGIGALAAFASTATLLRSTPADSSSCSRSALLRGLLGLWAFLAGGAVAVAVAAGGAAAGASVGGATAGGDGFTGGGVVSAGAAGVAAGVSVGGEGLRPPRGDGGADA